MYTIRDWVRSGNLTADPVVKCEMNLQRLQSWSYTGFLFVHGKEEEERGSSDCVGRVGLGTTVKP